jgi:hypothetical protein
MGGTKQKSDWWSVVKTYLLSSASFSDGNRDTKDGVGTELALIGGTVKLDEEVVDIFLLSDLEAGLDELGGDDVINVGNSFGYTWRDQPVRTSQQVFIGVCGQRARTRR